MMDYTQEDINGQRIRMREFMDVERLEPATRAVLRNPTTTKVTVVKVRRNEPCPCGSGDKFKKCCLWKVNCGVEIITGE